jgi:hypothetical protein
MEMNKRGGVGSPTGARSMGTSPSKSTSTAGSGMVALAEFNPKTMINSQDLLSSNNDGHGGHGALHTAGLVVHEEPKQWTEEELLRLTIRKKLEREVIALHDKSEINLRRECWYLLDCLWLNRWVEFTTSEDPDTEPPGPVSSKGLLGANNQPLPNLKAKIDYRGVTPLIYFLFLELYGRDKSPDICRYAVDMSLLPVPPEQLVEMQRLAKVQLLC